MPPRGVEKRHEAGPTIRAQQGFAARSGRSEGTAEAIAAPRSTMSARGTASRSRRYAFHKRALYRWMLMSKPKSRSGQSKTAAIAVRIFPTVERESK